MNTSAAAVTLGLIVSVLSIPALAYEQASSCSACHGDFTGGVSPKGTVFPSNNKHTMHRSSSHMGTDCFLCHTEIGDDPFVGSSAGTANNPGLGCTGCHVAAGLRARHAVSGINCYTTCHSPEPSQPENVKPPYYGTVDTNVDNPCNDVQEAKRNENWSIGDFIGLDNDGNDLYDQADFACSPYRILAIAPEGDDARITWETAGGRTDVLRAASEVDGIYSNVVEPMAIPGVGMVVTNRLVIGGASQAGARFYQLKFEP